MRTLTIKELVSEAESFRQKLPLNSAPYYCNQKTYNKLKQSCETIELDRFIGFTFDGMHGVEFSVDNLLIDGEFRDRNGIVVTF